MDATMELDGPHYKFMVSGRCQWYLPYDGSGTTILFSSRITAGTYCPKTAYISHGKFGICPAQLSGYIFMICCVYNRFCTDGAWAPAVGTKTFEEQSIN